MNKRQLKRFYNKNKNIKLINEYTTDEIFTELMKRILPRSDNKHCFVIDDLILDGYITMFSLNNYDKEVLNVNAKAKLSSLEEYLK